LNNNKLNLVVIEAMEPVLSENKINKTVSEYIGERGVESYILKKPVFNLDLFDVEFSVKLGIFAINQIRFVVLDMSLMAAIVVIAKVPQYWSLPS
jgi:uncharacterized membrane protein